MAGVRDAEARKVNTQSHPGTPPGKNSYALVATASRYSAGTSSEPCVGMA
jgi:hypothetical protein